MKLIIAHTVITKVDHETFVDSPEQLQLLKEKVEGEVQDMFMDFVDKEEDLVISVMVVPVKE